MTSRLPFIDSDAHVLEPVDMFEKYLEPKFRDRMPYACADYQGEPLAFGFELRIPAPDGGEYVMPFGRDPLTGKNTIDHHSHFASLDAGSRTAVLHLRRSR